MDEKLYKYMDWPRIEAVAVSYTHLEGTISQYGKPEEIIKAPANNFVKEFILKQLEIKKNNIFSLFQNDWNNNLIWQVG